MTYSGGCIIFFMPTTSALTDTDEEGMQLLETMLSRFGAHMASERQDSMRQRTSETEAVRALSDLTLELRAELAGSMAQRAEEVEQTAVLIARVVGLMAEVRDLKPQKAGNAASDYAARLAATEANGLTETLVELRLSSVTAEETERTCRHLFELSERVSDIEARLDKAKQVLRSV